MPLDATGISTRSLAPISYRAVFSRETICSVVFYRKQDCDRQIDGKKRHSAIAYRASIASRTSKRRIIFLRLKIRGEKTSKILSLHAWVVGRQSRATWGVESSQEAESWWSPEETRNVYSDARSSSAQGWSRRLHSTPLYLYQQHQYTCDTNAHPAT